MRYVDKKLIEVQGRLEKIYLKEMDKYKNKYAIDKKYFTLSSYLDYFGVVLPNRISTILGTRLTRVCNTCGILIFKQKVIGEFRPEVNSYPTFLMRRIMMESFTDPDVWTPEGFKEMTIDEFLTKFFEGNKDILYLNRSMLNALPVKKFKKYA